MAIHPASIKNTFMSHLVFWVAFMPLLTIVFMPMFSPNANIDPSELEMISSSGVDTRAVSNRVNKQFTALFINTGVMPATETFFGGETGRLSGPQVGFATSASSFAGNWVRGIWVVIYRTLWRVNALIGLYIAAILAICLPAMVDGLAVRARKRYHFENYNPVFFYFSSHSAVLVIGLLFYLPLVPLPLTGPVVAAFLAVLGLSMWWAAANFQTGS